MQSNLNDDIPTIKTVLIGESGTGKTSIIQRYCKGIFKDVSIATLGSSFQTKEITLPEGKIKIKLEIWDTAGQEAYRALNKIFYKDAKIFIFVYDITKAATYQEIKAYWLDNVRTNADANAIFCIAGNKQDLYRQEEIQEKEVETFAEQNEMIFKLVSAKGNHQINDLFLMAAEKCHKEIKYFDPSQTVSLINDDKTKKENNEFHKNVCC